MLARARFISSTKRVFAMCSFPTVATSSSEAFVAPSPPPPQPAASTARRRRNGRRWRPFMRPALNTRALREVIKRGEESGAKSGCLAGGQHSIDQFERSLKLFVPIGDLPLGRGVDGGVQPLAQLA